MNDEMASEIVSYLKIMARIQALSVLNEGFAETSNREKIVLLDRIGFTQTEIASIIGTTPGTVQKELSIMRANPKKAN